MGSDPEPGQFELVRLRVLPAGVFGVLLDDWGVVAATLERTYDAPGGGQETKIPEGLWQCRRTTFFGGKPEPYETYEVVVPGHSRLLFHKANFETELEGCIALGLRHGPLRGLLGLLCSVQGFQEFVRRTAARESFPLLVRSA